MDGPYIICGFLFCGPLFGPLRRTSSLLWVSTDGIMYGRQCGLFAQWPHVALVTVCFHVVRRRVAFSFPKGHEKMSKHTVGAPRWYFCLKKAVHLSSTDNETGAVDLFISKRAMMCGCDDICECFAPVVQRQLKNALRSTELQRSSSRVLARHRDEQL